MTNKVFKYCFVVTAIALLTIIVPIQSFATHKSEDVVWQMVYLSDKPGCGVFHYDRANLYDELAEKYMSQVYEFKNSKYQVTCMAERDYDVKYQAPDDLDLLILIYEDDLGERDLHQNNIGGLYHHSGDMWTKNHTIIICDCDSFYYSEPTWLLSHELAHFMLFYLGFSISVSDDFVHGLDEKHDLCVEGKDRKGCDGVIQRLRLDSHAYSFVVMAPYEPAINMDSRNANVELDELFEGTSGLKLITQWWTQGKISDKDYKYGIQELVQKENIPARTESTSSKEVGNSVKIFTEPPKGEREKIYDYEEMINDEKIKKALEKIPSVMKESESDKNLQTDDIPDLIKDKAEMWLNGDVSDGNILIGITQLLGFQEEDMSTSTSFDSKKGENTISIEDTQILHDGEFMATENSVKVAGWVIPDIGTTDITIRDEKISSDSRIEFTIESAENNATDCNPSMVKNGEFHIYCDNHLDNALINYKVYTPMS